MVSAPRAKAVALLAGVFVLGAAAGATAMYAYELRESRALFSGDRAAFERHKLSALGRELDLSEEQVGRVRQIFERHRGRHRALRQQMLEACGEPVRAQRAALEAEIKGVLTPEQQGRFDELKPPAQ